MICDDAFFVIQTFVVDAHIHCLRKVILISTNSVDFYEDLKKIIPYHQHQNMQLISSSSFSCALPRLYEPCNEITCHLSSQPGQKKGCTVMEDG